MSALGSASHAKIFSLFGAIQREVVGTSCYADAAQRCMNVFYNAFPDELALCRLYVTTTYQALPPENRRFVDRLASSKSLILSPVMPVLSLVGTCGLKPEWNDRRQSVGHLGIPLASEEAVAALPMVARLLSDIGAELHWIERAERGISTTRAGWSGLFHVEDARTSCDRDGRLIIPAQDFVAEQSIRTVFGVGGSYASGSLFAMVLFTRSTISRESAQRFLPLATLFKTATRAHIENGHIFAPG